MKKSLLLFSLCGAVIFTLSFLLAPDFNKFIKNQLATVIGIDINEVRGWQQQKGLNQDLTIGDSGNDVRLLQVALNKILPDFPTKNITGYFGTKTSMAVSDFQITKGLNVSGILDANTRSVFNDVYFKELCPDSQGNIYPDEILIHVNKNRPLPSNYIPENLIHISDLVKTIGVICIKQDVAPFIKQMFDDATRQGIILAVTSGFRRPEMQSIIYKMWLFIEGEKGKNEIAEPLHSEHQLGTTVDISSKSIGYIGADDTFDGTVEDAWLKKNAYKYGFVMSYPKNKILVTGYKYEPWHYRFVGVEIAKQIFDKQISIECQSRIESASSGI